MLGILITSIAMLLDTLSLSSNYRINEGNPEKSYAVVNEESVLEKNGSLVLIRETRDPQIFQINTGRFVAASAVGLAGIFRLEVYQENAWWRVPATKFRFVNDSKFVGNFDKLGHIFGAYVISSGVQTAMDWCGYNPTTAAYIGAATALLEQTYVEMNDGFSVAWGFSPGDEISNFIGALYPVAQAHFPELQHFNLKLSYWPSQQLRTGYVKQAIDDYEGMTIWLSADVHHYLPQSIRKYWPKFLNLAGGTGVDKFVKNVSVEHEWYFALDINVNELPGDGWFLRGLKRAFNYIHLPLPAVRISPHTVTYLFYF